MAFFTIIIPTFNAEKTLQTSLNSVQSQSYADLEIQIIDGASTDETLGIAKQAQSKDRRIFIHSGKDKGVYDAMNKGLTKANGDWVYILGADDIFYDEEVLRDINEEISRLNPDVIYGNVFSVRLGGLYDGEFDLEKLYEKNICHQSIFFRKSIFDQTGYYELKYYPHADWDHNVKWFLDGNIKKRFVPRTIAYYADDGLSSRKGDPVFQLDKADIFYKLAGKNMGKHLLSKVLVGMAIKAKANGRYMEFLMYKIRSLLSKYA